MLRPGHQLVLAGCFQDPQDAVVIERGTSGTLPVLSSDHEEADTRIMLHAEDCSRLHPRLVIQSPDTDVAVLGVHVVTSLPCDELWMKTGVRDKLRYIPIYTVADMLGLELCRLLPAFHSLTGCDTTRGLYKLGKKRAFKSLRENAPKYDALDSLGDDTPVSPDLARVAEQFICSLYTTAVKAGETADEVR